MQYHLEKVVLVAVLLAGLVLAPFFAVNMVDGNFVPFMALVGFTLGCVLFFGLRDRIWISIPGAAAVGWQLGFLPIPFNLHELSILAATGYMILTFVVMDRRKIEFGSFSILAPIVIVCGIVLYHFLRVGGGMHVLGSNVYGGRANVNVLLGVLPFIIILSCAKNQPDLIRRTPAIIAICAALGIMPNLISTFFPSTAPMVDRITGRANMEAFNEATAAFIQNSNEVQLGRINALGAAGIAIQTALLSYFPVQKWWRPKYWFVLILSILAFYLCVRSGFRNTLFTFGMITIVGGFLRIRWSILPLVGGSLLFFVILLMGHGDIYKLPLSMQRSLSFLPGKWDPVIIQNVEGSDDFRQAMHDIYWPKYGLRAPWFGDGFAMSKDAIINSDELGHEGFIERKQFHEGTISIYDSVGVIGIIGTLWLIFSVWKIVYRNRDKLKPEFITPLQAYAIMLFFVAPFSFIVVYGDMRNFFPGLTFLAALILISFRENNKTVMEFAPTLIREEESQTEIANPAPITNVTSW
ncbi:MAG: hypothetical protein AAF649_00345 [Verrucomicrobiota bacterium]